MSNRRPNARMQAVKNGISYLLISYCSISLIMLRHHSTLSCAKLQFICKYRAWLEHFIRIRTLFCCSISHEWWQDGVINHWIMAGLNSSRKGGDNPYFVFPLLGYNILIGWYYKLIISPQLIDNQIFSLVYTITWLVYSIILYPLTQQFQVTNYQWLILVL